MKKTWKLLLSLLLVSILTMQMFSSLAVAEETEIEETIFAEEPELLEVPADPDPEAVPEVISVLPEESETGISAEPETAISGEPEVPADVSEPETSTETILEPETTAAMESQSPASEESAEDLLVLQDNEDVSALYSINNISIPIAGYLPGSYHDNCWVFAQSVYNILWNGAVFSSGMYTAEDLLRNVYDPYARLITAENTQDLITHSRPGAVIRLSYSLYDDGDYDGHSMILVYKDAYGLTVYHGNWGRTVLLEYLTWDQFVQKFAGYGYIYFKYIKWPGAPAYSSHVHTPQLQEAVEPTYLSKGNIAYYLCPDCGKMFADQDCMDELDPEDIVLDFDAPGTVSAAAVNSTTGVTVTWEPAAGADCYVVYRKASYEKKWTKVAEWITDTSYLDKTAVSGTRYLYAVRGYNNTSKKYGAYERPGFSIYYMLSPGRITAEAGPDSVTVTWSGVKGANLYYVYRKAEGDSWKRIGSTSGEVYTDTDMESGVSYFYTVRAYNAVEKVLSAYRQPGANVKYLETPTLKTQSIDTGVQLIWDKVSGADAYRVSRKPAGGKWEVIVSRTTDTAFIDKTADPGTVYYYTVKAYQADWKLYSTFRSAVKGCWVCVPVLNNAKVSGSSITISWKKAAGSNRYYIYRRIPGEPWHYLEKTTALSFTDTTAQKGVSYLYAVRAYNSEAGIFSSYQKPGVRAVIQ